MSGRWHMYVAPFTDFSASPIRGLGPCRIHLSTMDESNGGPSKRRQDGPRLAYLGPEGTYGHQAAMAFSASMLKAARLVPCETIYDVWTSDAEYIVMPLENTIHGGVRETLNCIASWYGPVRPSMTRPPGPQVMADLDLPVDHSLIVKAGISLQDIKWVKSHEQALGQCARFLDQHLPNAKRIPVSSTAGAAASLLDSQEQDSEITGPGAAIGSKSILETLPGLEILHESIQAVKNNFTRFLLFTRQSYPIRPVSSIHTLWVVLPDSALPDLMASMPSMTLKTLLVVPMTDVAEKSGSKYPRLCVVELSSDTAVSLPTFTGSPLVILGQSGFGAGIDYRQCSQ
ncbi:Prephenate dehydratase-domain-containing protein [Kockovaella imperatae]|uniref:Prephenate dehydratase-domain-containing protein n=1 Tax=Kockovaella imperatae TaxID=4999 RepID=A0A1Y1UT61_9TREE|nr:Prephenate dehydratase-domain-containing protein [Kockovaella imperatae]ORX41200.1 Prephenate dehydratase-domain-containing protein [Kockovaella imperatae]